ncbi:MAG: hypothetical protein EA378_02220 [Phycisphaerales bacterium]|nr:MAG: hypothetical protein EA378_02220 [Phycisphaerales bacterium]
MTAILGISAFYHDSAAALVVDGQIVAAAQEERFTRKKHDHAFPMHAIDYCLSEAGLQGGDLDYVAFYDKPLLKFERLLETYLAYAPRGFRSFVRAMPLWLRHKLHLPRVMRRGLGGAYTKRFVFTEHHESHAASAFFPSPFEAAAILTLDGVGEWATASFGVGRGRTIELSHELRFPHSLGLLYSAFTYFCGFKVNSGEYKLMGLAPFGEPRYAGLIREKLIDLKPDGSFRLDMRYFNYCQGLTMTNARFASLFGGPARSAETPITQREMDLAASVQVVTEDVVLAIGRHVHERTGMRDLCLAGGVALNCVANGRLLREGPFERVWVQPAAGDAGGALGSALFVWHQLLEKPREASAWSGAGGDAQRGSLLGPAIETGESLERVLSSVGAVSRRYEDDEELAERVALLLASGKVVGWCRGRMEFGPRALGARSILGDPRSREMQSRMNVKIKFRESFRPFAPAVLAAEAGDWFELGKNADSPYMLLVGPVAPGRRVAHENGDARAAGLDRVREVRSQVPAVTHVDHSARVQTVDRTRNPGFSTLIEAWHRLTGCPVLVNTSFNVRGEPIVATAADAYRCFMATNMDALVVGDRLLLKEDQPGWTEHEVDEHLAKFELD